MREFIRGDKVVLLKELVSYAAGDVPAGTKGEILDWHTPTTCRVIFDGYGIRHVRKDILSLASKGVLCVDTDATIYTKIVNENYITASTIAPRTFNIASSIKDVMAVCKKVFGNEGNYYNTFKKWLPEEIEFEVGEFVKLSKEIYGLSAGTLVYIADIDKEKEDSYIIRDNTGWKYIVDKKYLRRKTK